MRSNLAAWSLVLVVMAAPGVAGAADDEAKEESGEATPDAAWQADKLFEEGRELAAAEDYEQACDRFARSHELRPGIGTLFNLADCNERLGKLALAHRQLTEVVERTRVALQRDREKIATDKLRELETRVPRLIVAADKGADRIEIELNGEALAPDQWGRPIPLDPGTYLLRARERGTSQVFEETLELGEGSGETTVEIPFGEGPPMKRKTGLIVAGSVLMGVGLIGAAVGGSMISRSARTGNDGQLARGIGVGVAGLACIGVGVPLFVIGLRKRPVEPAEGAFVGPQAPMLGARSPMEQIDPFGAPAASPIPEVVIGAGAASATWYF